MSKVLISESYLEDISDAIREKLSVETEYKPSEMAAAIQSIPTGGGGGGVYYAISNRVYEELNWQSSAEVN